jgi:predicted nucleic acid-binding protein
MQIEEGHRDGKSYRYGLGVAQANRIGQRRHTNLLLIAALAVSYSAKIHD